MPYAKLVVEKLVDDGVNKMYKIVGFEGVKKYEELPGRYQCERPRFYAIHRRGRDMIELVAENYGVYELYEGQIFPEEKFNYFLEQMKKAGDNLSAMRKEAKELRKTWYGTVEIII